MKKDLIKSIEEFREKWHLLGYKGWLAEILIQIVNLLVTKDDIASQVQSDIPIVQFPKKYFSEEDKVIDGKKYKVISASKEFEERLEAIEKFIKGNKDIL